MAQMVENAEEHYEVESAEGLGMEIIDTGEMGSRPRTKGSTADFKLARHGWIIFDADNFCCSPTLGLETKEPFRMANIQNAHSGHVRGQTVMGQLVESRIAPPRSDQSARQLHFEKPIGLSLNPLLQPIAHGHPLGVNRGCPRWCLPGFFHSLRAVALFTFEKHRYQPFLGIVPPA